MSFTLCRFKTLATIAMLATGCTVFAQSADVNNWGARLATVNDTSYYLNYNIPPKADNSAFGQILGVTKGKVAKRTLVSGLSSQITANGADRQIIVGVDTVSMPFRDLPADLRVGPQFMLPNSTGELYNSDFSLYPDRPCNFRSEIYVPNMDVEWMLPILKRKIMTGIAKTGLMQNNKAPGAHIDFAKATTLTDLTVSAARMFEKMYKAEYAGQNYVPSYEYFIQVLPVWETADRQQVTVYVYTSYYTGGAHGMYEQYYVTFDTHSHKAMGISDILTSEGADKAIDVLGAKLAFYQENTGDSEGGHSPAVDADPKYKIPTYYEAYKGKVYPRPAMLRNGLIFSYQPYDKGSYAEGVLNFLVPYTELYGLMKVTL